MDGRWPGLWSNIANKKKKASNSKGVKTQAHWPIARLKPPSLQRKTQSAAHMLCASLRSALSFQFRRYSSSVSLPFAHNLPLLRHLYSARPQLTAMASNQPKDEAYLNKVIPKRIQLFESKKARQLAHLQSLSADPIK